MTTIRRMELGDLEEVKKIQDSYSYWEQSSQESEREGFFLRLLSERDMAASISDPSAHNLVYQINSKIGGYFMGNLRNQVRIEDEQIRLTSFFNPASRRKLEVEGYAFAHYVAKAKGTPAKPIIDLENEFFSECVRRNIPHIVALICVNPFNKRSWDFHTWLGWRKIGEVADQVNERAIEWGTVYLNANLRKV